MNCASSQGCHSAQEIFNIQRITWLLPTKCKATLKQDVAKLPIKGCILLRILPHMYTPKLNTGFCPLGGKGQQLRAGPRREFRCTGNKPWAPTCPSPASSPAHLQLPASRWPSRWPLRQAPCGCGGLGALPGQRMGMRQDACADHAGTTWSQTWCFSFPQQRWSSELALCSGSSMVFGTRIWTPHYSCARL